MQECGKDVMVNVDAEKQMLAHWKIECARTNYFAHRLGRAHQRPLTNKNLSGHIEWRARICNRLLLWKLDPEEFIDVFGWTTGTMWYYLWRCGFRRKSYFIKRKTSSNSSVVVMA